MKKTVYILVACLCLFVSCEKRMYTAMEYYRAILNQDVKTVKNILKQHKNPVMPYTESERLQLLAEFGGEPENMIFTEIHPLLLAAHTGNEQILTELLAHKVDVQHKNQYGQTALMLAVESGLPTAVSLLLKAGADVDSVDANMMSALHYAIKNKSLEMVTLLFSGNQTLLSFAAEVNAPDIIRFFAAKGASIEEKNSDGQTALFYAVENDAFDAAKALIEMGAQINLKDNKNCSPISLSVRKKSGADFIRLFAAAGAIFEVSDTAETILSHSIRYGTPEVTAALLEAGVTADGEALHTAIAVDSAETIRLLITAGADIRDKSVLEAAVKNDSSEITALLLEAGAPPGECLYLAKSSVVFKQLLEVGANVFVNQKLLINRIISCPVNILEDFITVIFDGISHDGKRDLTTLEIPTAFCLLYAAAGTGKLDLVKAFANDEFDIKQIPPLSDSEKSLLVMAARGNSLAVVSYLLENGFDADNASDNALYEAVQHENSQPLVSLLLEAGADANGSNNLFVPLCVSRPEYTKQLLKSGAQVDFIDGSNSTPLTSTVSAFEKGDDYLAAKAIMLLEAGADPYIPAEKNAIDIILKSFNEESPREGWTDIAKAVVTREKFADLLLTPKSILYAAQNNNENAVHALVALGADVKVCTENAQTALMYACINNNVNLATFFLEKGCDINAKDNDGRTALIHACKNNAKDSVIWLVKNGADINIVDTNAGWNALIYAKAQENMCFDSVENPAGNEIIGILQNAHPLNVRDADGMTNLTRAVRKGDGKAVKELLAKGADPDIPATLSQDTLWPLDDAIRAKNYEIAQLLIEANAANTYKKAYDFYYDAITVAKDIAMVRLLIKNGVSINSYNSERKTPLVLAIEENNFEMVKLLVDEGARFFWQDKTDFVFPFRESEIHPEILKFIQEKTYK